jgi:hypothetical protein
MVFKDQLNAHIRLTLKVKVKVIQGQIPVLVPCESSSLPNAPRAALAVNRDGEAWVKHSEKH